jgi:hypothetical protein
VRRRTLVALCGAAVVAKVYPSVDPGAHAAEVLADAKGL